LLRQKKEYSRKKKQEIPGSQPCMKAMTELAANLAEAPSIESKPAFIIANHDLISISIERA
jgi:hypothetical protein